MCSDARARRGRREGAHRPFIVAAGRCFGGDETAGTRGVPAPRASRSDGSRAQAREGLEFDREADVEAPRCLVVAATSVVRARQCPAPCGYTGEPGKWLVCYSSGLRFRRLAVRPNHFMKPLAGEAVALFISLGRSTPGRAATMSGLRDAPSPLDHHRRRHRARAGGDAFARRFRRPAHRPGRGLPGVQRALPQLPLQVRSGRLRVRRAPRRGVRGRRVRPLVMHATARSRGRIPEFSLPMRLAGWDCASDCKFRCMQSTMALRPSGLRPPSITASGPSTACSGCKRSSQSRLRRQRRGARPLPSRTPPRLSRPRPSLAGAQPRAPVARQRRRERQRMDVVSRVPRAGHPTHAFHGLRLCQRHLFLRAVRRSRSRVGAPRRALRWPLAAAFCLWFAAHVRE